MSARTGRTSAVTQFLQRHLLPLILLSYVLAATWPGPGLWIKAAEVIGVDTAAGHLSLSVPTLLLATLMFTAGLRARIGRVGRVVGRPGVLAAGLVANLAVPMASIALMLPALRHWHSADEAAMILLGLALVTSMPIAGSSTGWSQAADGDMALSLGLVLGSTLLSPLTTPAALHALGSLASGRVGMELHRLAGRDTGAFLTTWVLLPSAFGLLSRALIGEVRAEVAVRRIAPVAPIAILMLCYANASGCLPGVLGDPDWDFLGIVLLFVVALCGLTFAAGHLLGRFLRVDRGQRASLLFGLGMNNNGTGLVLASVALGSQPMAMMPIIAYNLAQHVVAGCVNALLRKAGGAVPTDPPPRPRGVGISVRPARPIRSESAA